MKMLSVDVPALDLLFLQQAARTQGISKAEFLRRLVHDARMVWVINGLWDMAKALQSLQTVEPPPEKSAA